ncbi:MAG TPA: hypothetical protein VJT33_18335 [bacterium]|nr:hypothetical protein [bacterium]
MALVFTFPCGRCGKKYSIYYPKKFIYSVYGTGTPAQGEREDAEELASGAIAAARQHAETSGNVWIDASQVSKITCTCGKNLDLNIANHPRVPQRKAQTVVRQTGVIAFPAVRKPAHGPAAHRDGAQGDGAHDDGADDAGVTPNASELPRRRDA